MGAMIKRSWNLDFGKAKSVRIQKSPESKSDLKYNAKANLLRSQNEARKPESKNTKPATKHQRQAESNKKAKSKTAGLYQHSRAWLDV